MSKPKGWTRWLLRQKFVLAGWLLWLLLLRRPILAADAGLTPSLAGGYGALIFTVMLGCVFMVVHHADDLAEQLGEPYGTLVLTLSATIIEATLLLLLMLNGEQNPTLLRDTVFATLMVVLNGLVGLALVAGGWRHVEQAFNLRGALSYLHIIAPLSLMILVLPDYTRSTPDATFAPPQEVFLGVLCVLVYAVFLRLQMGRHRSHFTLVSALPEDGDDDEVAEKEAQGVGAALKSVGALLFALMPIVLLSEDLAGLLDFGIEQTSLPPALGGLLVTSLVLAPEGLGSYRAAIANRVQRSINICLGSALSTIALTVPTVLIAAVIQGHPLVLGLDRVGITLLEATLMVALITFVSGRANMLQGTVHLMLFAGYLFFMFSP